MLTFNLTPSEWYLLPLTSSSWGFCGVNGECLVFFWFMIQLSQVF